MAIGTLAPAMDTGSGSAHAAERSRVWRKFVRNPGAIGGALVLLIVIGAALAPYVAPHEPARQSLIRRFTPPIWTEGGRATYVLGTDQVGRDILSRMTHGARVSLIVGMSAVLVSLLCGRHPRAPERVPAGPGGHRDHDGGGRDAVASAALLALAFVAALGPSLLTIIMVLGLTGWTLHPAWSG